ncbi:tryptophan 2,3-dioxygenase, partial [Xanthomonas perforans]
VGFLQQALALTFFPELFDVRTSVGVDGRPPQGAPDAAQG